MKRGVIWCAVSTQAQMDEEKDSLPSQERDAREYCEREGVSVVKVLRVPGHSRKYIDIHDCAASMLKKGVTAFAELLELWDNKAFDVLVTRDFKRFARSQTLHAYVIEKTISIGAQIYSLTDGWVNEQNADMAIALGGFQTNQDYKARVRFYKTGMDKRVDRGFGSARIPMSHLLVRDPSNGHPTAVILNPEYTRLWADLASVLLSGLTFRHIGYELYETYGHYTTDKEGEKRAYSFRTFHRLLNNPMFWGHSARGFGDCYGSWAYDENAPIPEGVKIKRNVFPAVYTGELAAQIQAELARRTSSIKGRASTRNTRIYTGLLVCSTCGLNLTYNRNSGSPHWRCGTRFWRFDNPCPENKVMSERKLKLRITEILSAAIESADCESLFVGLSTSDGKQQRITQLKQDIAKQTKDLDKLITMQMSVNSPVAIERYAQRIQGLSVSIEANKNELIRVQAMMESHTQRQARTLACNELLEIGLNNLWTREEREINQILHKIFGIWRLEVRAGDIVGLIEKKH